MYGLNSVERNEVIKNSLNAVLQKDPVFSVLHFVNFNRFLWEKKKIIIIIIIVTDKTVQTSNRWALTTKVQKQNTKQNWRKTSLRLTNIPQCNASPSNPLFFNFHIFVSATKTLSNLLNKSQIFTEFFPFFKIKA